MDIKKYFEASEEYNRLSLSTVLIQSGVRYCMPSKKKCVRYEGKALILQVHERLANNVVI